MVQFLMAIKKMVQGSGDLKKKSQYGQPHPSTHPHLLSEGEVTPMTTLEEYRTRRNKYLDLVPQGSLSLFAAAETHLMTANIPYPYRQDSNFSYLCGLQEPGCYLLLEHGTNGRKGSTLFMRARDKIKESWDGSRTGHERAIDFFGVDKAYSTQQLHEVFSSLTSEYSMLICDGGDKVSSEAIGRCIRESKFDVYDARPLLHQMRLVKSKSEISLMEKCSEMSGEAHLESMRSTRVGMSLNELYAFFEYSCRKKGCQRLAYPPVVSSGIFNNTLHYVKNDALIMDGELVLLDGGGEYFNYASDITRTWPANGKFTSAQRDLYSAVLNVQKKCIEAVAPGVSLNHLHRIYIRQAIEELVKLKVVDVSNHHMVTKFCPHMVGHYLGMDVHDVDFISSDQPLRPGTVITIEPGMYIPHDVNGPFTRFEGLGIRIEDDVLVTPEGHKVITSNAPKDIDHIEHIMSHLS